MTLHLQTQTAARAELWFRRSSRHAWCLFSSYDSRADAETIMRAWKASRPGWEFEVKETPVAAHWPQNQEG